MVRWLKMFTTETSLYNEAFLKIPNDGFGDLPHGGARSIRHSEMVWKL